MQGLIHLGDINAVSAGALCFIEHLVGFAYERVKILEIATVAARHSESRGDTDTLSRERKRKQ